MDSSGNKIVDAVGRIAITGNVIPQNWYKTVTYPSGKPYLTAIIILADIVYWYRPTEVRDERTGQVVALRKRFKADLLQRSYADLSEQFGISKREAKLAVTALEHLGVVKRHLRTLEVQGSKVSNVLFIELVPAVLHRLTFADVTPMTSVCHTSNTEMSEVTHADVTPLSSRCQTNTETTTETSQETTTENSNPPSPCGGVDFDLDDSSVAVPSREDVRRFCCERKLRVDPDRFFDENERRGWVTKNGKPVDDWRRYVLTWDRYENEPAQPASEKRDRKRIVPSIEKVMEDYGVDRIMAGRLIQEGLF